MKTKSFGLFFDHLFGERKAPPIEHVEREPENWTITRDGEFIHAKESTYGGEIMIHVSQCALASLVTCPINEKVSNTCALYGAEQALILNMGYEDACVVINS